MAVAWAGWACSRCGGFPRSRRFHATRETGSGRVSGPAAGSPVRSSLAALVLLVAAEGHGGMRRLPKGGRTVFPAPGVAVMGVGLGVCLRVISGRRVPPPPAMAPGDGHIGHAGLGQSEPVNRRTPDMRILHTADWHLGQTLNGWPRVHEHRAFSPRWPTSSRPSASMRCWWRGMCSTASTPRARPSGCCMAPLPGWCATIRGCKS